MDRKSCRRDSNFELLRILAMFAIIAYHFYLQTPVYDLPAADFNHFFAMFFGSFGRASVNIFVMIGAWHLVDIPFKSMRIVKLYLTTILYTVLISLAVLLVTKPESEIVYKTLVRAILPFSGSPLWFITDYIFLLMLSPFLNILVHALPQKKYLILSTILLLVFSVIPTVANLIPGINVYKMYIVKSDMGWILALYLLVGYMKKYPFMNSNPRRFALIGTVGLIFCCLLLCFADCFLTQKTGIAFLVKKFHAFLEYCFMDLASVFNILLSYMLFRLFQTFSFSIPWINKTSENILGIVTAR